MKFSFIVRVSFRVLRHHKGRSILTLLGIVIGITGIVAISAIGKGSQKKMREQILAYGSKALSVQSGSMISQGIGISKPPVLFTLSDVSAIVSQCKKIRYISPISYENGVEVMYEGKKFSSDVNGVNDHILDIYDEELSRGVFFTKQHIDRKENVVVISHDAVKNIFKWENPLGKTIRLNKIPFTIIGVLAPPKLKMRWEFCRLKMYVPFSTCKKLWSNNVHEFQAIDFCAFDEHDNKEVRHHVVRILRSLHRLDEDTPDDFMIWDVQMMADAAETGAKIIALFALIAASIALFVGGIGVMNIMLVAVQERTKEIGLKISLGAVKRVILTQFLCEATVLCLIGGIFGVLVGVFMSWLLGYFTGLPVVLEIMPILVALFITVLIGLFFGYYPARKASLLDPVEALQEK